MLNALYKFTTFLGHGRALEAYLAGIKLVFGLILLPGWPLSIKALSDLQWFAPDPVIAAPFLLIAGTQGVGLYLNARGVEESWILRAVGATGAIMMWSWLLTKSILIGEVSTSLTPLCLMSLPASVFILWKALNRLPVPGAAGLA